MESKGPARPGGGPTRARAEEAAVVTSAVRAMTSDDLPQVASVTETAFAALHRREDRAAPAAAAIPALLIRTRLTADPAGCFVAVSQQDPGRITGALLSVARGTLGWFGPLAVHPQAQRCGAGRRLVAACVDSWRRRGVCLMGLATFPGSEFHRNFYRQAGFRQSCGSIGFRTHLATTSMPDGIQVGGQVPDLGFLYPGLDVSGEAAAARACGAGLALTAADGMAIVHLEPTVQPPGMGYVPFLAAATRTTFDNLLGAAEHLSRERGRTVLFTRASSSSWPTIDALTERGYQPLGLMTRMKVGENPSYDHTACYYLDSWL
jgi:GNAT superfamily N-acetyltransferase